MNTYQFELESEPDSRAVRDALLLRSTDIRAALTLLQSLSAKGSAISSVALGDIFAYGRYGISRDRKKGRDYFIKAKSLGSTEGAFRLARYYIHIGDAERSIFELNCLSDAGFSPASFILGDIYHEGKLLSRDVDEALRFYKIAESQGHLVAKQWVGHLIRKRGGIKNSVRGTLKIASTLVPMLRENKIDPQSDRLRIG